MSASDSRRADSRRADSKPTRVRAFAPATVANVGCGLDVFGFALAGLGDEVTATRSGRPGVEIEAIHGDPRDVDRLPRDAERNTAGAAVLALLRRLGRRDDAGSGVRLVLHKHMPLSSGLGSSAASGVAALVAVVRLLDLDAELDAGPDLLLACALEAEAVACGSAHADNAAPCLRGGFVLVRAGNEDGPESERVKATDAHPPEVLDLPVPAGLTCAIVRPHLEVETRGARSVLGNTVSLASAVRQWGNTAGLVAALYRDDVALLGRCVYDAVAEPKRAPLVPGFDAACAAARSVGAVACGLSGSGPSIFALCADPDVAECAADAMATTFRHAAPGSPRCEIDRLVSPVGAPGACVVALD